MSHQNTAVDINLCLTLFFGRSFFCVEVVLEEPADFSESDCGGVHAVITFMNVISVTQVITYRPEFSFVHILRLEKQDMM